MGDCGRAHHATSARRGGERMTRPFTLADVFEVIAEACPERLALIAGDRRLTYAELDARANRIGHALRDRGLGVGAHVAILARNRVEWVETMLGCYKARLVPINVNYRYVEDELRYVLDDCDAQAVVVEREFQPRLDAVADKLPLLGNTIVIDGDYEDALATAGADPDFGERSPDDRYILYTGGTTGLPKGVVWRQEDIYFAAIGA